ncbi:hypothetical protein OU790_19395, partial [Ruegeria sp. NA]
MKSIIEGRAKYDKLEQASHATSPLTITADEKHMTCTENLNFAPDFTRALAFFQAQEDYAV